MDSEVLINICDNWCDLAAEYIFVQFLIFLNTYSTQLFHATTGLMKVYSTLLFVVT